MRYAVMFRDLNYKSMPDRPVRFFPFRFMANLVVKLYTLSEKVEPQGAEFFVVDYEKWIAADGQL